MLVSSHINSNLINMSKLFVILACLTLAVAFASAEPAPRFAKLQTKLSCSLTDVVACEGEIEGTFICLKSKLCKFQSTNEHF